MPENLEYAGKLVTARARRSWLWLWIPLCSIILMGALIWMWFWSRPYVAAHRIAGARTPIEEKVAFEYAHEGTCNYSVRFYDATGREIFPRLTGVYGPVTTIRVNWDNGASVTAPLRDTNNLDILLLPD